MPLDFMGAINHSKRSNLEIAVALIWFSGTSDQTKGISVKDIARLFEEYGYPKQNVSRLRNSISKDKRTTKIKDDCFRINPRYRKELDNVYTVYLDEVVVEQTSSVVSLDLFKGTRGYIEKVVLQLNASYDAGLYDCCAVMCRRLLETLIIEVYEHLGDANKLKGDDGHFMMFSGLKSIIEKDSKINLGRNTSQGLNDFKRLGDSSAHSRRFNARKVDIDNIASGLRYACEELLHLSGLIKPSIQ